MIDETTIVLRNPSYRPAIVGSTDDGALVYDYSKMVQYLIDTDHMTEEEAVEFIDYNTMRAIPYFASSGIVPIIMHSADEDPELQDLISEVPDD